MFYAANIERTLHSPTKYYKLFPFTQAFNSRLPILLAPSRSSLNLIKSLLNPMKPLEITMKSHEVPAKSEDSASILLLADLLQHSADHLQDPDPWGASTIKMLNPTRIIY